MTVSTIALDHVDLLSRKGFDDTVRDLVSELGKASTQEITDRLAGAEDWPNYAAQCAALAGPSGLIEVGRLDWGAVLTLSGIAMKASCFIICNPVAAQKLLATGDPALGLYLPTKILVFEAPAGDVHVAYDRLHSSHRQENGALSAIFPAVMVGAVGGMDIPGQASARGLGWPSGCPRLQMMKQRRLHRDPRQREHSFCRTTAPAASCRRHAVGDRDEGVLLHHLQPCGRPETAGHRRSRPRPLFANQDPRVRSPGRGCPCRLRQAPTHRTVGKWRAERRWRRKSTKSWKP